MLVVQVKEPADGKLDKRGNPLFYHNFYVVWDNGSYTQFRVCEFKKGEFNSQDYRKFVDNLPCLDKKGFQGLLDNLKSKHLASLVNNG